MTIITDKVPVKGGADFTFVCSNIPFAVSCTSDLPHGAYNMIDLDLINQMNIPLLNIKVTRMTILGRNVRAVGTINQTVQCVHKGKVQGTVHIEAKVVRNLFSMFNVDCIASAKTYGRLVGQKPADPPEDDKDDNEDSHDDEATEKEAKVESGVKQDDHVLIEPDPPDIKLNVVEEEGYHGYKDIEDFLANAPLDPSFVPRDSPLNGLKPHLRLPPDNFQDDQQHNVTNNEKDEAILSNLYAHYDKYGPGPRDLMEIRLNSMQEDEEENEYHCDLCFHEGKPIKVVRNHDNHCPTCPSLNSTQKLRMHGPYWKQQAEMIFKMRYMREKENK